MSRTRSTPLRATLAATALGLALVPPVGAQLVSVSGQQKISNLEGGLPGLVGFEERFGWDIAPLGDLDGDGFEDIAVGSYRDDLANLDVGTVKILLLNGDGTVKASNTISENLSGFNVDLEDLDWFGWGVEAIGDLDNDGVVDLAVGAPGDDDGGTDAGAVYILFLNTDGTVKAHQKLSATVGLGAPLSDFNYFGCGIAALGDQNNDGFEDIAVGAFGDPGTGGFFRGACYVIHLTNSGAALGFTRIGESSGGLGALIEDGDEFGWDVAPLGDVNGDGFGDLAVSALLDDDGAGDAGAVYVLFLDADGVVLGEHKLSAEVGAELEGLLVFQDWFGRGLANAGDLDGDGIDELLVGAAKDDGAGFDRGAVWVLQLDATGAMSAYTKLSDATSFGGALDDDDQFGRGLAAIGDLDGNGTVDLAVGASRDDDGADDAGAVWIVFLEGEVWSDLGQGLAGTGGVTPLLVGDGDLTSASTTTLTLTDGLPLAPAGLVIGVALLNAPFKGGTMVPFPNIVITGLPLDGAGGLVISFPWPGGAPGIPTYWQYWISDPAGPVGFSASNAVQGVTQ